MLIAAGAAIIATGVLVEDRPCQTTGGVSQPEPFEEERNSCLDSLAIGLVGTVDVLVGLGQLISGGYAFGDRD